MGIFIRRSRTNSSILCGLIWSKFELLLDIMHVFNTNKFTMDQINSKQEKVATSIFSRSKAGNSVNRGKIWPNFGLIQALMYMYVIIKCNYEKDLTKNS